MGQELKLLLGTPFHCHSTSNYVHSGNNNAILMINTAILDIVPYEKRDKAKTDLLEFIAAAMNEKYERVFHTEEPLDKLHPHIHCPQCQYPIYKSDFDTDENGDSLRWIKTRSLGIDWIDCPKCNHGLPEGTKDLNCCPFCGQKLLPPEDTDVS